MTVAASRRPGLVAPDIPANVREARAFAQLGDVPRRLARLVGTREPLELVGTDHVIGHRASLEIVATSPGPGCGNVTREAYERRPASSRQDLRCIAKSVKARLGKCPLIRTTSRNGCNTFFVNALRERVEEHIRSHELIEPGGSVLALVSGGPDSTCLWLVLRSLGYRVDALHVNHGLRGEESEEDARFCRDVLGAEVVDAPPPERPTEEALRDLRYSFARDRLRATGHTASDQVETVLYRLVASGTAKGIKAR